VKPEKRAFYEYHASLMNHGTDQLRLPHRRSGDRATLDRNGLRPGRYVVTDDDLVVMAPKRVFFRSAGKNKDQGRLQPGKMFLVTRSKRIISDKEIKKRLSARQRMASGLRKIRSRSISYLSPCVSMRLITRPSFRDSALSDTPMKI